MEVPKYTDNSDAVVFNMGNAGGGSPANISRRSLKDLGGGGA
jgi:hypothetical protein